MGRNEITSVLTVRIQTLISMRIVSYQKWDKESFGYADTDTNNYEQMSFQSNDVLTFISQVKRCSRLFKVLIILIIKIININLMIFLPTICLYLIPIKDTRTLQIKNEAVLWQMNF